MSKKKKSNDNSAEKAKVEDTETTASSSDSDAVSDESKSEDAEAKAEDAKEEERAEAKAEDAKEEERAEAKAEDAKEEAKKAAKGDHDHGHHHGGGARDDSDEPREGEELYGLLAEFDSPGALVAAAEKVRDAGFTDWDCYSPFPVHGLDPAMGIKRTILPVIVFVGGLCGLGGGLLLQWWTNAYNWPWIISGKPFFSLPANIPVTFEATILLSVFSTFFGMWILNKLPQVWHPFFRKERFRKVTDDGFFVGIQASDRKFQRGKAEALLREAGAVAIETCYTSADPNRRKLPKPVTAFILITTVMALVPFALVAKARTSKSEKPHIHIFPDMDFQPRFRAQDGSDLFDDGRASRRPVAGTVARGELKADDHFYRGIQDGKWATTFPGTFETSKRMMERGEERFNIYCRVCHGASGKGDGMIHERTRKLAPTSKTGWVQPTNLHQEYIVRMPHGQLFHTIGNGVRSMPGYAAQIPEADRWAIVMYIRALQRSQYANLSDVPPEARKEIR